MTEGGSPPRTGQAADRPDWRAFLSWVERAAGAGADDRQQPPTHGTSRTWGQLQITPRQTDGDRRRHDLRHVDDGGVPATELTAHDDPTALHEIARVDADGQYRPLAGAPTLRTGWVFRDLDGTALCRAVEACYPASIANWHREREGDLDVTHWRETAARQTGIYDVVEELTGDQVERLAAACCVDSQCLRRREWDESPADELDAPRGDGAIPCREPCSLVVAAAREIAVAEREAGETVTLSLAERERAQLERILDAVAEGRADDVRDGDLGDGANQLRVRYLREALFGDE